MKFVIFQKDQSVTIIWVFPAQVVWVICPAWYCIIWTANAICYSTWGAVMLPEKHFYVKAGAVWSSHTRNGMSLGAGNSCRMRVWWMVEIALAMNSKNQLYHILGELGSCNAVCYICKGHCFLDSISHSSSRLCCSNLDSMAASLMCRTHH